MKRDATGRYEVASIGGERVRAFVPAPLPPKPALLLDGSLQQSLELAILALGRLDSVSMHLPDESLFLYAYVRKEAVLSSQIEGTQSSLSDLLLYELDEAPGVPMDDVREVSNYVAAVNHGLQRMRENFPLSNRLIREMHQVLLQAGEVAEKRPVNFAVRRIGSAAPGPVTPSSCHLPTLPSPIAWPSLSVFFTPTKTGCRYCFAQGLRMCNSRLSIPSWTVMGA